MITAICRSEKPRTPVPAYGSVTSETELVLAGQTQVSACVNKITVHPKEAGGSQANPVAMTCARSRCIGHVRHWLIKAWGWSLWENR